MKTSRTVMYGPGNSTDVTEYTYYTENDFRSSGHYGRDHADVDGGGDRRHMSGSGTRNGGNEEKRLSRPTMKLEGRTYDEIKKQCLRENRLFVDPDFPPTDSSIILSRRPSRPFHWLRPSVSNFHAIRPNLVITCNDEVSVCPIAKLYLLRLTLFS